MQKKCVISLFSSGHTFLGILAPLVPPIERLERGFRSWKRKCFRFFLDVLEHLDDIWEQKHSWAINDWFKSEQYWIRKIMMSQPRHIIRLVRHIKWSLFGEVTLLRKSVIRRCILVGGGGGRGQVGLCKTFATTTKIACKCSSMRYLPHTWYYIEYIGNHNHKWFMSEKHTVSMKVKEN